MCTNTQAPFDYCESKKTCSFQQVFSLPKQGESVELNHPDEAQSALAEASRIIASPGNDGGYNWLHAEILYREAETKINGKTGKTTAEEKSKPSSEETEKGDGK